MRTRRVFASRTIAAAPEEIFDLLADPRAHPLIDGSGTVRDTQPGTPTRLELGTQFGMAMRMGSPYKIQNTVVEFEENRLIAWRHFNGHRWRWRLEPHDSSTIVTETFDWSTARVPIVLDLSPFPRRNKRSMERTLERLAELVEPAD